MKATVAVLLACHNRKHKTLNCLQALFAQELPNRVKLEVYLVDDGSTDGTGDAVRHRYPAVTCLSGDGQLYWSGAMQLAWKTAAQKDPEFYLWLNDDTTLLAGAIRCLIRTHEDGASTGKGAIIVGSCRDPQSGEHSYGGEIKTGHHPVHLSKVVPQEDYPRVCHTFNGNCVLISRAAFNCVGMMRRFQHALSDTDYGLRATRASVPVLVAAGYVAECERNRPESSWTCESLSRSNRFRKLIGRKGLPPSDWWHFLWAHSGLRALLYWPVPYLRVLLAIHGYSGSAK